MSSRVGIALGSNLGNRLANICEARDRLLEIAVPESRFLQAPVYESQPVDCADDAPNFLNTVIEICYAKEPYDLLAMTQKIELDLGRETTDERNAPRVIDVDILYFGREQINEERLTLPHPRLLDRRFVLQPLHEICSDLVLLNDGIKVVEHYLNLKTDEAPLVEVVTHW